MLHGFPSFSTPCSRPCPPSLVLWREPWRAPPRPAAANSGHHRMLPNALARQHSQAAVLGCELTLLSSSQGRPTAVHAPPPPRVSALLREILRSPNQRPALCCTPWRALHLHGIPLAESNPRSSISLSASTSPSGEIPSTTSSQLEPRLITGPHRNPVVPSTIA